MKSIFTTVITGPDNPEILRSLASETRESGGEWLIVKAIKLDGRFAALARVTIAQGLVDTLKTKLAEEFPSFSFSYHETPEEKQPLTNIIVLEIDCLDRPGLTRDISDYMSNLELRVENMESTRHPIGTVASTVYSTRVTLSAPKGIDGQNIADKLEALPGDIQVNVI